MLNDLLYNKKTAYIAVVLMIIISVFILGGNSLIEHRERVVLAMSGQNEFDVNVFTESAIINANGANLLVVSNRYLDGSDELITNVSDALNESFESELQRAVKVVFYAERLIDELSSKEISEASRVHLTEIEGNIYSALFRIELSGYNALAVEFNRLIANPYTSLIATVRGVYGFFVID